LEQSDVDINTPLRFGSYVTASILGIELKRATSIPRHLIINNRVAILDDDSKLHYTDINIVRQDGANVIITQGINDGDQLIISALDYPIDGMQLALPDSDSDSEEKESEIEDEADSQLIASIED